MAYGNGSIKHHGHRKIDVPFQNFGERFIEIFNDIPVSKWETKFVELSFLNDKFAFIPKDEFSTDTAQRFLEIQSPLDPFSSLRFNPIDKRKCVVCFNYNEEIEFFLENKYPFVNIIHNSNRNISKIPGEVKNIINIIFTENIFEIIGVGNQFDYYNCKTFENEWDVVYAVKHYLNNKSDKYSVNIYGSPNLPNLKQELEQQTGLKVNKVKHGDEYSLIS